MTEHVLAEHAEHDPRVMWFAVIPEIMRESLDKWSVPVRFKFTRSERGYDLICQTLDDDGLFRRQMVDEA